MAPRRCKRKKRCCKGGAADCFTALHTRRRCCWDTATVTLWTGDGRYLGAFTAEHHPCMALAERRRVLGELAPAKAEFRATAAHAADGLVRATRLQSASQLASKPQSLPQRHQVLHFSSLGSSPRDLPPFELQPLRSLAEPLDDGRLRGSVEPLERSHAKCSVHRSQKALACAARQGLGLLYLAVYG